MPALSSCGLKMKPRKSYRIEPYSGLSNYRSCNFNEEPCFLSVRNQPDIFPPMLKLGQGSGCEGPPDPERPQGKCAGRDVRVSRIPGRRELVLHVVQCCDRPVLFLG